MYTVFNQDPGFQPTFTFNLSVTLTEKINGEWLADECTFEVRNVAVGQNGFSVTLPDGTLFSVRFDDYVVQVCAW